MVELEGIIENIVYKNDENGYTVAKIRNNNELVAIVGYIPYLTEGQRVKIQGQWIVHQTFGQQIKVESCEEVVPTTLEGVEKYLASGLIPGIGPVTAHRIVSMFGMDSLDIMEMNPEKLTEVEGIGEKKAAVIVDAFKEQKELRQVMVFLQSYGISTTYGIKIFKRYGQNTIKNVKENPYRLCDDISGIGFKTADKIARNLGIDMNSEERIKAGIKYILSGCTTNGHTFLPSKILYEESMEILGNSEEMINNAVVSLVIQKQLVIEEAENGNNVYLSSLYYSELGSAKKLLELSFNGCDETEEELDKQIEQFEKNNNIEFAEEQKKAITQGAKNGVCIITGGPGTGKTTIIKCIIKVFENRKMSVVLAAPTGRAAKRITETTGYEAKTIHRLLEMGYMPGDNSPVFAKDECNPIEADAIIIDEASMVDIILMNSLLKAITIGTKLIMVGDVDQLPSVGPGNVLRDIINSNTLNVIRLKKIFRQSNESLITINAHMINRGEMPVLNERDKDFFFIQKNKPSDILEEVVMLVDNRLPSFKNGFDPMKDIQVLSPTRKGETGIYSLNMKLQQILNPPSSQKAEKQFKDYILRVGDKVMQIKNNYSLQWQSIRGSGEIEGTGVFNGDIGFVQDIDLENQRVTILFDEEKKVMHDFSSLDEIELAYAITIHKSQGSEFPVVVIPVNYGPPMLMTRNLIYTGVTRAKQLVVLVGIKQSLYMMINNNAITERYSGLKNRIVNIVNLIK